MDQLKKRGRKRTWQPAASAPKDRGILVDIGYPWPLSCRWDAEAGKWAIAMLNFETANESGEARNVWWETEYEIEIKGWIDLPDLPPAA